MMRTCVADNKKPAKNRLFKAEMLGMTLFSDKILFCERIFEIHMVGIGAV